MVALSGGAVYYEWGAPVRSTVEVLGEGGSLRLSQPGGGSAIEVHGTGVPHS
jgi:hypothetical protein